MQGPMPKELGLMTQALTFTAQRLQLRRSNRPMVQRDLRNNNMLVELLARHYPRFVANTLLFVACIEELVDLGVLTRGGNARPSWSQNSCRR